MLQQHIESDLAQDPANDLLWWRRLTRAPVKWTPPDKRLIIVTTEGRIIGPIRNDSQVIRNFMGQSDNTDNPKRNGMAALSCSGRLKSATAKTAISFI